MDRTSTADRRTGFYVLACAVTWIFFLGGCAGAGAPVQSVPAPITEAPRPQVPATETEHVMEITSEPTAARILINNQPVGRTPMKLAVKVTANGFCEDYVVVKARFVADDVSQISRTVEEELTPREKVPAALVFTPEGARRRLR